MLYMIVSIGCSCRACNQTVAWLRDTKAVLSSKTGECMPVEELILQSLNGTASPQLRQSMSRGLGINSIALLTRLPCPLLYVPRSADRLVQHTSSQLRLPRAAVHLLGLAGRGNFAHMTSKRQKTQTAEAVSNGSPSFPQAAQNMLDFINHAWTPFHAVGKLEPLT